MENQHKRYETFLELCTERKSVRDFSNELVLDEDIEKILKVTKTSPYASGRKNWDIIVIKDRSVIKQMCDQVFAKAVCLKKQVRKDLAEEFEKYSRSFCAFKSAPVLFLPVYRIVTSLTYMMSEKDQDLEIWEKENFIKSISAVSTYITLAAQSLGLSSCYMTGPLIANTELCKLVKVKPGRTIGAVIPVGHSL